MRDVPVCDILVVGAGPGGIAAAVTATEGGRGVVLVDDNTHAGGQIWRHQGELPKGRDAARWIGGLARVRGITHFSGSRIVARISADTLLAETPEGPRHLRFRSLIVATGARELFLPFPGWTLPGVMGAGALQALVKSGLEVGGKRVLVAGTGPLLLAVASLLRSRGAVVPMIAEQAPAAKLRRFAMSLMAHPGKLVAAATMRAGLAGTHYATDSYIVRVAGSGSGLDASVRRDSHERTVKCDYVACGFNLIPNNELACLLGCETGEEGFVEVDEQQRTTLENVYAIGELTGIGGAEKAVIEGEIAAMSAMGGHARLAEKLRRRARMLSFVRRLRDTFALRPELLTLAEPETIICRCEDVPLSALARCTGGRESKLQTRCGMGACQGRVCGAVLQRVFEMEAPIVRPPLFPTAVETLVGQPDG